MSLQVQKMSEKEMLAYLINNSKILPTVSEEKLLAITNFFFDKDKNFLVHSAAKINAIDPKDLAVWCNKNAIYCIPSQELIDFLKEEIGEKSAIEIGAGYGYVGKALGIISTDSYLQLKPEIRAQYQLMEQPIIKYPERVKNFEASEAVRRFKPDVVIGCWITQKSIDPIQQSSRWGINEKEMLRKTKKYIVVGHEDQHNQKKILKFPHKVIKANWICSRSQEREKNLIYIWEHE